MKKDKARDLLQVARTLYEKNKYPEALKALKELTSTHPNNTEAWIWLGDTFRELNKHEEALESYNKAIALDPKNSEAFSSRGKTLSEMNRFDDALESFNKAIALNPKDAWSFMHRGQTLEKMNRFDEALLNHEKAIELDPDNEWAWIYKGDIFKNTKRYLESLETYDKAIKINPNNDMAWITKGDTLLELRRYEEALKSYNEATKLSPKNDLGWINKGDVFRELKNDKEALKSYDKAIKVAPSEGLPWFVRGRFLTSLQRLPEALSDFEKSLKCYRTLSDAGGVRLAESWIQNLQNRLTEQEIKKEPPVEVLILRTLSGKLQSDPKKDPLAQIREREESFDLYFNRPRTITSDDNYLVVLRRWNSFTPKIPNRGTAKQGGGYFLVWKGKGIVIDPGFDFMNNFDKMRYSIRDIDAVVLTHAHTDHTADFEALLCLKYELSKKSRDDSRVDLFLNIGTMNKFIGWISRVKCVGKIVSLNPGDSIEPEGYHMSLKAMAAKHSDVIGENCLGLVFDLKEGSRPISKLGITSDTGWSSRIERQYRGCELLCAHLGSIGENEFIESLPLKGKKRLYGQHLGLIGTISIIKSIHPSLSIISEFGEELGNDRYQIAAAINSFLGAKTKCLTGDIGLRVQLPSLAIYCDICEKYQQCSSISETPFRDRIIYHCSAHTPKDFMDHVDSLSI